MIGHEFIRREICKAEAAFTNFDPKKDPWKANALHEWLTTFLFPALHMHHHAEDEFLFPFYLNLGVITPERQTDDHVTLEGHINKVMKLSKKVAKADTADEIESSVLEEMKAAFEILATHMRDHMSEEEIFWPPVLKKFGGKNWTKITALIAEDG